MEKLASSMSFNKMKEENLERDSTLMSLDQEIGE